MMSEAASFKTWFIVIVKLCTIDVAGKCIEWDFNRTDKRFRCRFKFQSVNATLKN